MLVTVLGPPLHRLAGHADRASRPRGRVPLAFAVMVDGVAGHPPARAADVGATMLRLHAPDVRCRAVPRSVSGSRAPVRGATSIRAGDEICRPDGRTVTSVDDDLGSTPRSRCAAWSSGSTARSRSAGVDLDVPAGSFFGLLGPNGAGKTTTLSMAVGLLRPDAGRGVVLGHDVWADPVAAKRLLGVLPDGVRLFDRLTGAELLAYTRAAARHGAGRGRPARRASCSTCWPSPTPGARWSWTTRPA